MGKAIVASQQGLHQSKFTLAAIVSYASVASAVLMMAPAIAQQLAVEWQVSEGQIGALFSIELGAMSVATIVSWYWLSRLNWRLVGIITTIIFIIGNAMSGFVPNWSLFIACRLVTALSSGTLMILTIASAAQTVHVQRTYSLWVLGQLLLGALGLAILPVIFARFNLAGCYIALALLALLAIPLIGFFPKTSKKASHAIQQNLANDMNAQHIVSIILAVVCVLLFYIGLSGIWTFAGTFGERANVAHLSAIFSIGTIMGILGSAIAGLFPVKAQGPILFIGYLLMAISVLLFIGVPSFLRFSIAVLVFKFAWTFLLPWILSTIALHDNSGKLMSSINLVIGAGFAIGPYIAGKIIEIAPQNTSFLFLLSSGLLIISWLCIVFYNSLQNNRGRKL